MSNDALQQELVHIWNLVREAFSGYRLDEAIPYLQLPEGAPRPTRDQARQLADFLPDISSAKLLSTVKEGDRAGVYVESASDGDQVEVTVLRFQMINGGWKIGAPPHSFSSYATDRKSAGSPEELVRSRPELKLIAEA